MLWRIGDLFFDFGVLGDFSIRDFTVRLPIGPEARNRESRPGGALVEPDAPGAERENQEELDAMAN